MADQTPAPEASEARRGPGGATFRSPAGWALASEEAATRLTAPDRDFTVALVDAGAGGDAEAAAAAAWRRLDGRNPPALKLATAEAARNGWDAWHVLTYDTPADARAWAQAYLLRQDDRWTALLLDGAKAAFERRGADIAIVLQTVSAPGHARESLAGRVPNRLDGPRIEALKAFLAESMQALDIPGASLAIVDGSEIVFAGGFGVRALGGAGAVDADTRFLIASCTKPLTTLMLARLADEGALRWDQPVRDILPEFELGDAALARRMRVRDLLSASTGLPRKDFVWAFTFGARTPASKTLDLLAGVRPTTAFGEAFQYNNLVAAAAGYVGGHAAYPALELGAAYDRAMQTRVFDPLGMTRTTFDVALAEDGLHARPHSADASGVTVAVDPALNVSAFALRPSGGAWSTARDMAAYVRAELRLGLLPGGGRLVSEESLLLRRRPVVAVGADGAYGVGLFVDTASDVTVVRHGGSLPGFGSDFFVLPEAGVGAVVLANADAGGVLAQAFKRRLLEVLYDAEPKAAADVAAAVRRREAETAALAASVAVPPPADVADSLAASYRSEELGALGVERDGAEVRLRFASGGARVGARREDGALVSVEPGLRGIVFERDVSSSPAGLIVRDGQHDYRYAPD